MNGGSPPPSSLSGSATRSPRRRARFEAGDHLTCLVAEDGCGAEIDFLQPDLVDDEARTLVRAVLAGTYSERERRRGRTRSVEASWPEGSVSSTDHLPEPWGPDEEFDWRRRDYERYKTPAGLPVFERVGAEAAEIVG